MEVDEKVTTGANDSSMGIGLWNNNRGPFATRATAGTALGFGIAGTALGLMSGGLNLFNTNKSNNNASDYPTAFEVYKKCEDYRFTSQGELSAYALSQANQRFDDAVGVGNKMFDLYKMTSEGDFNLYKLATEGDFKLYKDQRDQYDALLDKIHEVDSKVSYLSATIPLEFALENSSRTASDNAIVSYANSMFRTQDIADVTLASTSKSKEPFNPLKP